MANAIVLGVAGFELLEPRAKRVLNSFANAVLSRMESQRATPLQNGIDAMIFLPQIANQGIRDVEIYGIWEDRCVYAAAREALKLGMAVKVPKGYTMTSSDSAQTLSEKMENEEFPGQRIRISQDKEFVYLIPRKRLFGF